MTLKRAQVVMLPTNEKASTLWLTTSGQLIHTHITDNYKKLYKPQAIYILSNEKIEVGDWVVHGLLPLIYQVNKDNYEASVHNKSKKIIATTDSSLFGPFEEPLPKGVTNPIPKPSEDFIKVFVEEYNKGNIIEWVDVEYSEYKFEEFQNMTESNITNKITDEYYRYSEDDQCFEHWYYASIKWINSLLGLKLKVNSKNEISIRKIKETWSRDEILNALNNPFGQGSVNRDEFRARVLSELGLD